MLRDRVELKFFKLVCSISFTKEKEKIMKSHLTAALTVSIIALTACSSSQADVGSRDDIIVKNRGDVSTSQMAEMQTPPETAPILTPEATMETDTAASDDINTSEPIAPAIPAAPVAVLGEPVQATNGDIIVPVTTPSVASGDIVVEVPEAPVQTPAGAAASVSNVVTEHQGVDEYAPVQPIVTENQEIDTADEVVEEVMETMPEGRTSPYVPTY